MFIKGRINFYMRFQSVAYYVSNQRKSNVESTNLSPLAAWGIPVSSYHFFYVSVLKSKTFLNHEKGFKQN